MKGRKLTVSDLRNMNGEQVYIKCSNLKYGGLVIVDSEREVTHRLKESACLWSFKTIEKGRSVFDETVVVYEWIKQFTKSNLKTGMRVELGDGWMGMVLLNTHVGDMISNNDEFITLDEFNENLTHIDGGNLNIVKVFKSVRKEDIYQGDELKLVWERKIDKNKMEKSVIRTFTYNSETITLVHKDNWTTVRLQDGIMAKSRCHPEDSFDRVKGTAIAYYRAKEKQIKNKLNELVK